LKEQMQQIGRVLLSHADLTATGVLFVMLLIIGGLYFKEQAKQPEELPPPPVRNLEARLPNDAYNKVMNLFVNVQGDITKDPELRRLTEFNMFDLKSVQAEEKIEAQLDEQVEQANRLINAGKNEEALKILDSVLSRRPRHVRALDLKNQLLPAPSPTPTPGTP